MIVSMTGYGSASAQAQGLVCQVELRAVNNRFFKISIRLDEHLADCEVEIERLIRSKIARGSVTVKVTLRGEAIETVAPVNAAAAKLYLQQMLAIAESQPTAGRGQYTLDLPTLLTLPGVCMQPVESEELHETARNMVNKLVQQALDQLLQMRRREGESLAADLTKHLDRIGSGLEQIKLQAPQVVAQYHQRLRARVQQLVSDAKLSLNDADLLREVALFGDRADISEELARLQGHLDQFTETCRDEAEAGRKLEFIAQEMLREANTIGSKASDSAIARCTVDIKSAIDRIKEQVQNVE
ncbi:MAG: YicC family protein [Phycisphaerales bacterium]|nr:YicC family protein [Phycisphaerales bacterium]